MTTKLVACVHTKFTTKEQTAVCSARTYRANAQCAHAGVRPHDQFSSPLIIMDVVVSSRGLSRGRCLMKTAKPQACARVKSMRLQTYWVKRQYDRKTLLTRRRERFATRSAPYAQLSMDTAVVSIHDFSRGRCQRKTACVKLEECAHTKLAMTQTDIPDAAPVRKKTHCTRWREISSLT